MKRITLLFGLSVVILLLFAPATFAMQAPYVHGDFGNNSTGCGNCHITHSANAAKLVNDVNQTALCLGCHGFNSPFGVKAGMVEKQVYEDPAKTNLALRFNWGGGDLDAKGNMSLAGGFETSGVFMLTGQTKTLADTTSVHNVRGIGNVASGGWIIQDVSTYEYVYGDTIPGGSQSLDFECGSCHDPHAGGPYQNNQADKNPRLLKEEILGRTGMRVKMEIDQAENLPTKYTSGFNRWCGACHDIFDTSTEGANVGDPQDQVRTGYYKIGGRQKYMHLFGIDVNTAQYGGATDPYTVEWLALQNNSSNQQKEIMCMTCHRAHGSSARSDLTWTRYGSYNDYDGSGNTTTGKGSALLRLPDRDVCYGCHGAAQYNHSDSHS